jgi:hypothetical protein
MRKTKKADQYSELNRRFHRLPTEPCPNAFLKIEIDNLWNKVWLTRSQSIFQLDPTRLRSRDRGARRDSRSRARATGRRRAADGDGPPASTRSPLWQGLAAGRPHCARSSSLGYQVISSSSISELGDQLRRGAASCESITAAYLRPHRPAGRAARIVHLHREMTRH